MSLDVAPGETLCVIGPNGAGKTTLMNTISGTVRPQSGTITLLGQDISRMRPHQRTRHGLGRTFQTSYLFNELSVEDNLQLADRAPRGTRGGDARPAVDDALAQVGLGGRGSAQVGSLSHGERRKVEIAMALVSDAEVLLLDEPMAGVSAEDVPDLVEIIRVYARGGRSIVLVEHHMDVVLDLADRVAVLHHGETLAVGTPDDVMADEQVQVAYMGEEL
ncbi:ABC transporter ATP-binding protein [Aeromicrobium sp. LTX1]|uniref:ABC transporter ATP-binding protein n=1 Tax=Aeromicrobium sp. LTX1 TaxID=3389798 RepID=UPI00396B33CC